MGGFVVGPMMVGLEVGSTVGRVVGCFGRINVGFFEGGIVGREVGGNASERDGREEGAQ